MFHEIKDVKVKNDILTTKKGLAAVVTLNLLQLNSMLDLRQQFVVDGICLAGWLSFGVEDKLR